MQIVKMGIQDAPSGSIIGHQVNCQNWTGAGGDWPNAICPMLQLLKVSYGDRIVLCKKPR